MKVTDKVYECHRVLSELKGYIDFYKSLAMSVFAFSTQGTNAIANVDSYVYSSIQGTLESIQHIFKEGRINDAYALLRKYYDSAIINIYTNLYLQDHFSIENFVVKKINNWLQGKDRLPEYRVMSHYIRSSGKLTSITDLLFNDERYKKIRDRCNNHTHYNFFVNMLLNDNEIRLEQRVRVLDSFAEDARDIFILHLACIFFLNDHYMMSSDHLDYLECGMTPEPDSQYWVAPFIQEMFDNILTKDRPDIMAKIKQHSCMHIS